MDKKLPEIMNYFVKMEQECFEETGYLLNADDIEGHLESDEFREKFGTLSFPELFNYLVHND